MLAITQGQLMHKLERTNGVQSMRIAMSSLCLKEIFIMVIMKAKLQVKIKLREFLTVPLYLQLKDLQIDCSLVCSHPCVNGAD